MRIEVLYVPGCRNYEPALERMRRVLAAQSVRDRVVTLPVSTEAEATVLRFPGSPTIRINVYQPGKLWDEAPPEPDSSGVPVVRAIGETRDQIQRLLQATGK